MGSVAFCMLNRGVDRFLPMGLVLQYRYLLYVGEQGRSFTSYQSKDFAYRRPLVRQLLRQSSGSGGRLRAR